MVFCSKKSHILIKDFQKSYSISLNKYNIPTKVGFDDINFEFYFTVEFINIPSLYVRKNNDVLVVYHKFWVSNYIENNYDKIIEYYKTLMTEKDMKDSKIYSIIRNILK